MSETTMEVTETADVVTLEREQITAPAPLDAQIFLTVDGEGWRGSARAALPDAGFSSGSSSLRPSRLEAVEFATEAVILWSSSYKDSGSKKQRKQAAAIQEWAFEVQRREQAASVPVQANVEAEVLQAEVIHHDQVAVAVGQGATPAPSDPCPQCGRQLIALHGGARHGQLICFDCDSEELYAHEAEREQAEEAVPGMPAILKPGTPQNGELRTLPLDEIHESPWNPRKDYPHQAMRELVDNMRASGFRPWLPIVVRPRPEGGYEIGAGHRRSRAARQAGLTFVPCMVREMSDEELLDVLNFDNSGRSDVHPLDESAGWHDLMQRTGKTPQDIAARIGQSLSYVYQRLHYARLIPDARAAFYAGSLPSRHAVMIARRTERDQLRALMFCFPSYDPERRVTVAELAAWIAVSCDLSLVNCGFDPSDASLLPYAGSCLTCPKRSGSDRELYADIEDPNICTDATCYQAKCSAMEALKPMPEVQEALPEFEPPAPATAKPPQDVKSSREAKQEAAAARKRIEEQRQRWLEERSAADAEAAAERAKDELEGKVYDAAVARILQGIRWPLGQEDFAMLVGFMAESCECTKELCDLFAIHRTPPGAAGGLIQTAIAKFSNERLARFAIAALLLEHKPLDGELVFPSSPYLALVKRHKVDLVKIRAELEGGTRREVPKTPKDVIGKLGTVNATKAAKKHAPAAKKAPVAKKAAPAKKAAVKSKGKK